jgi:hypothetical protein
MAYLRIEVGVVLFAVTSPAPASPAHTLSQPLSRLSPGRREEFAVD